MSPKAKARLVGVLLLITILAGGFAQGYVAGRLIVSGDATATATNILAHQPLYRLAFAVYLMEMACQITMTVLFYELLKPVSKTASIVAAAFGLIGCTIKTLSRLFFFAPLLLLGSAQFLRFRCETVVRAGVLFYPCELYGGDDGHGLLWTLCAGEGLPPLPFHVLAQSAGSVVGRGRSWLDDLPLRATRAPTGDLHRWRRRYRISGQCGLAYRFWCERRAVERTGQRGSLVDLAISLNR
jgi:hypothetical protein